MRIVAVNYRGESDFSTSVTRFAVAVPSGIAAPSVIAGSRTVVSMALQWSAPTIPGSDILGYRLYVNSPSSNSIPTTLVYDGAAVPTLFSANVTGLQLQETYWFAVKALNRAGWSGLGAYLKVIAGPLPSPPPSAPVILSSSRTAISFRWPESPDAAAATLLTGYKVYDSTTVIASVGRETLSYSYTGVSGGSSYLISIGAVSLIGESELRSLPTIIWAVTKPTAPTLSIDATTRDSCSVRWSAVTPPTDTLITGYVILIDDGLSGEFRIAHDSSKDPARLNATIYGLRARTTYRLTGYALNKAGRGDNATEITCFTATTPGLPGTPMWVSSTSSSIEVKWEPAYDDGGSPILEYQL